MADTVLLKKIWTQFKIDILVFTLIPLMHLSGATTTIGISSAEVKTSDPFSITCTVSDLSMPVIFYKNGVEKGRCDAPIIPGLPGLCVSDFSQNITTNISTYSVVSANATDEDGTWSCKHSTETSNDLILIVYGFPANSIGDNQAYLPNNIVATNMDGTQLIVNISECVNPTPTISWTFYQDCEGTPISPTIVITSTISNDPDIACSQPYSAYKSTIKDTDMTNAVIGNDHCYRVRSLVAYPGTSFISVPVMFSANVTLTSPTTQTSTVFLTERIPTTNYNNEYSNTNVPLTSEIVTPNSGISEIVTSINIISAITTPNSLGKETTRVVDDECPSSTLISMSSENSLDSVNSSEIIYITLKHTPSMLLTSPDLHTETTLSFANSTMTLMSNLFVSSFDSFSSEQHSFFSRTIIKTSFLETSDIKSNTLLSITDVLSDSSSTFTKLPIVLLTSISISASSVRFYSTPLSTFAVANSTNELIGSTVKSTDFIVERISVLTYRTTTTDLLTLDISNSGIISKTEITDTESYLLMSETYLTNDQYVISDSVQKSTHSYVSSEFLSQILRTTQPIISIDTSVHATDGGDADTTHYSRVLLTYTPVSAALMSSKHSFLFEITRFFSTISLSGITLKTSRLESSMYSSGMEDDIITTDVQNSGFLSSISINLSQSIGSSISMKTSNYLVSTSVFASNPTTTTTETRIFMSGYLQSSFYPTDQDFSLRTTDYFVTTMQPTNSFLVSSTEKNSLNVNSKMRTTVSETKSSVHTVHYPDMLTVQNDSLKRTIVEQSDLRTSLVTSKSEFEHQWNSSMSNHSFSRTIDVTSFITAQSTIRNSFSSLLYSSDSSNVILSTSISFLYATSSADFISTTIHSTSNTRAGISETTKSAIFITIVSVVVIIIVSFSSIMLLSRVIFERKTVNVSLSNESQFPYFERAIYPRFSDSLSSYMTSPYDRNWNEV